MTVPTIPMHTKPDPSRKILVARFDSSLGAKAGLEQLKNAGARLGNAAVIEREADGQVSFTETQDWGIGKSAMVGALAAIVLPGIGMLLGAVAGGAAAYLIDAGFPDALLRQMGTGLDVGSSMLVVLVHEGDSAHAEQVVMQAGGTVLGSGVDSDLTELVERMRKGADPA